MPALPTVQIGPYEVTRLILGHNPQVIRWAFANIKPTDAVVVGVFQRDEDQLALNVGYALEALRHGR